MYTYEIIRVLEDNKITFGDLYKNHYPEQEQNIIKQMNEGRCKYYVVAKFEDQVIGCMGIHEKGKDFYNFLHLVVHADHTGKGIATNIVKNAIPLLINIGAKKLITHETKNVIKHSVFISFGFIEIPYPDDDPPLLPPDPNNRVYELTVGGTDGN